MRKVVTPFVFLSLFLAFWSCESQPVPKNDTSVKSKPTKPRKKKPISDSAAVEDSLDMGYESEIEDSLRATLMNGMDLELDTLDILLQDSTLAETKKEFMGIVQSTDSIEMSDFDMEEEAEEDQSTDNAYSEQGHFPEGGLNLEQERLVKTQILKVYRPDFTNTFDSTLSVIEKRISIQPDEVSQKMVVERWISPVNYRGYKFNRKKLMLYGVDKDAPVNVFYYLDAYYFSLREHIYYLKETNNNMALTAVKDSVLENYLLEYEDQL